MSDCLHLFSGEAVTDTKTPLQRVCAYGKGLPLRQLRHRCSLAPRYLSSPVDDGDSVADNELGNRALAWFSLDLVTRTAQRC